MLLIVPKLKIDIHEVYIRPVCFVVERAKAPRHLFPAKGHPIRTFLYFYWNISREPRAVTRGVGGNRSSLDRYCMVLSSFELMN